MDKSTIGFKEFFKAAIKDPKNVSTIFPTMKFLAQSLIIHSDMAPGQRVLELGCGSGAITRFILDSTKKLESYVGIELDENLVHFLTKKYPDHLFIKRSAHDLKDVIDDASIDTVICSLPWTLFSKELQESLIQEIIRVLKPGGKFTTFLCLHSLSYPGAPRAKKLFGQYFTGFEKKETVTLNIPPANVYLGLK